MASGKNQTILIVGAGVFGLSTALHLLRRGWKNVTIIDRSPIIPAPDAAGTDINKVVRSSYSDVVYTRLAIEAITAWRDRNEWGDAYHESGVILRGGKDSYAELSLRNDTDLGANIKVLHSSEDLQAQMPRDVPLGPLLMSDFEGYINFDGGWANAEQGLLLATEKIRNLGAKIEPGKTAIGFISGGRGVKLDDGTEMKADLTIIASGSWTASSFPGLGLEERIVATGQSMASIQLSTEEAKRYSDVPIILDYLSGFYVFPPNTSNILKFAFHSVGYKNTQGQAAISTPRTHVTHPGGGTIPREMVQALREALMSVYPEFASHPFSSTRLCILIPQAGVYLWDVTLIVLNNEWSGADSDWLIDFHPEYPSILFATGGSGHAYKFLPVVGRLVADRLENLLDPELVKKFSYDRTFGDGDPTRHGEFFKELDPWQLWTDSETIN